MRFSKIRRVVPMRKFLVCACSLVAAASLHGQIVNGNFETGSLPPWTTTGTDTVTGTFNGQAPAEGSFQAVISTPPGAGTVTQSSLEGFLELNGGTLDFMDACTSPRGGG